MPWSKGRAVPDIGLDGDPTTGMLVGETQNFALASRFGPAGIRYGEFRLGGTSLVVPAPRGRAGGRPGRRAARLRQPAHLPPARAKSYDRTTTSRRRATSPTPRSDYVNGINADDGYIYSVRTFDQDSSLTTAPGWDDVGPGAQRCVPGPGTCGSRRW